MIKKIVEPIITKAVSPLINSFFPYDPRNPDKRFHDILQAVDSDLNLLKILLNDKENKEKMDELIRKINEICKYVDIVISPFGHSCSEFPKYFKKKYFRSFLKKVAEENPDIKDLLRDERVQEWIYLNIRELINYIWERIYA